jgi:dolichol-phosphate mannosyltransferase
MLSGSVAAEGVSLELPGRDSSTLDASGGPAGPENALTLTRSKGLEKPELTIVLATLNERTALPRLIEEIRRLCLASYEVVVVDDGSTDGTREFIADASKQDPRIRVVLHSGRRTLGPAIYEGVHSSQGEYVLVMDSDRQHPAQAIPRIISKLEEGATLVVASRYSYGGSVGDRSPVRAVISRTAEVLTKALLPESRRVSDPLSGFFGFRRVAFDNLGAPPRGYKPLLAFLRRASGIVVEVPYVFGPRRGGESKIVASIRFIPNFLSEILNARRIQPVNLQLGETRSAGGSAAATSQGRTTL